MNVVYPLCNSIVYDVFDVDMMQSEVITQLLNDGGLATSRRPSNQQSHWLHAVTASTLNARLVRNTANASKTQHN